MLGRASQDADWRGVEPGADPGIFEGQQGDSVRRAEPGRT